MLPSGIYPVPCLGEIHYIEVKKNGAVHLRDHNIRDEDTAFRATGTEPPGCMSLLYSLRSPFMEHHTGDGWTRKNSVIASWREGHYRKRREERLSYNLRNGLSEWGEVFPFTKRHTLNVLLPEAQLAMAKTRYQDIPHNILFTTGDTAAFIVHINNNATLRVLIGIDWHKVLARNLTVVDGYFVLRLHGENGTHYTVSALNLQEPPVVGTAFIDKENRHLTWGLTLP